MKTALISTLWHKKRSIIGAGSKGLNMEDSFGCSVPPRPLEEIDADLKKAEEEIMRLLSEVTT